LKQISYRTHLLILAILIVVLIIICQTDCRSQSLGSWQIGLGLEDNNNQILQKNLSILVAKGAGKPKLNFRDNVFRLNGSDYYQVDFTAATIDSLDWLRIGMGGYQEDKTAHENYDPHSDLFLILGYDNTYQQNDLLIEGQLRMFITNMSWGWQIDRLAYIRKSSSTSFGISATGVSDKYIDRYGIGPIVTYEQNDYQVSLEYFIGDINWRLGGSYSF